ncbi:PREDICTED: uncharacterized protein LOC105448357 [Wasmannia auropunctata]|uniref:uncharacterized protein LOC105448357 n=1 Tax=Wasmannia auropunctata TaxID=64793 RepID=UPI0005F00DB7|nr:PREDICTED: uncharacterized protein LOC105448357 [Wasmannia auropunctata]
MSDLVEKQLQTLLHTLSRAKDNFKKLGNNNHTPAIVRSRIATLKDTWSQIIQCHAALIQASPTKKDEMSNTLDLNEDVYNDTLDYMAERLEYLDPNVSLNQSNSCIAAHESPSSLSLRHLPPLQLPPFSGKFEETFRDCFTALIIRNKELSDFTRMHFLSSSLTDRARDAIANLAVTADNFQVAWSALTSRFENKSRLIEVHVATLYNLPTMSRESAFDLHALRDKAERAKSALERLNRSQEDMLNDILVYFVAQKLDAATRRAWKLKLGESSLPPTYPDLLRFLSARALALEELTPGSSSKPSKSSTVTSATVATTGDKPCSLCKRQHYINKCPQFVNKSASQRRDIIKSAKRCLNCLSHRHEIATCQSKYTCRICQQRHHTMLHIDSHSPATTKGTTAPVEQPSTSNSVDAASVVALASIPASATPSPVLLATAQVTLRSPSGRALVVRALLDQGSEVTFVTERVAQILRLRRVRTRTSISTVGGTTAGTCHHATYVEIAPRDCSGPAFSTLAFIMKSLTRYLPRSASIDSEWTHLSSLKLADANPTSAEPIDVLIGADLYSSIILDGVRKGAAHQPIAQNSHLGWVLSGPTANPSSPYSRIQAHHCSLEQDIQKFWEIEEVPQASIFSPDERKYEEHFVRTHSRAPDGRYVVRLPFREGPPIAIGNSLSIAERMLSHLRRKLNQCPDLKHDYAEFMSEYETLGHMKRAPRSTSSQTAYIPHHSVIRETSATTRVRVVFNAFCETSNGTSLNTHLLAGPKLQKDLLAILLKWRQHKYVYTADIAKMYRQILVDERDINYQRILWLAEDESRTQEYQLLTVTYGTACAPFLALRVLEQLVLDDGDKYPLAASILRENIYVDDVLFGAEDIPLLRQSRDEVRALLKRGGFELRKWASNQSDLLSDIEPDNHGLACNKLLQIDERLSILGLSWNPARDVFQFHVSLPDLIPTTKRAALSTIARLFDPLGWVTPVTVAAKIFIQKLWRLKYGWNEELPADVMTQWRTIYYSLSHLNGLALPRWSGFGSDSTRLELHGFADASSCAYAAVVYIRVTSLYGDTTTTLLAGKSKVAPLKPISIPRLELSAAVLLSRLMNFIASSLKLEHVPSVCWSDSTVVLAWLNQDPSKWRTFVTHRVSAVQALVPKASWRHVPTRDNPADCASRGILGSDIGSNELW